ncbi:MAG: riboflavin synthase [Candidatus Coatesbacteria bacterium]|nr:riboflavin synthase [Candidatus Coatesbacteria bacterium]
MFTGLIEAVGGIESISKRGEKGLELRISSTFDDTKLGDSISVSGACFTVTDIVGQHKFGCFVSAETLSRSKFGSCAVGDRVNLERAVRPTDRLGGHIVQGHVDDVGEVASFEVEGDEARLVVEYNARWDILVVEKGAVAVDGVSLTVADCTEGRLSVALVPYSLEHTTLKRSKRGDRVNLEFDIVAKHVVKGLQSLLPESAQGKRRGGLTIDYLKEHGFY